MTMATKAKGKAKAPSDGERTAAEILDATAKALERIADGQQLTTLGITRIANALEGIGGEPPLGIDPFFAAPTPAELVTQNGLAAEIPDPFNKGEHKCRT
jgi:hypothetical protein